jgi:hypothetical protein
MINLMFQEGNFAMYRGVRVKIMKILPKYGRNRSAKIDINGRVSTVNYFELKEAKNRFTVKKTADQVLSDVLEEIDDLVKNDCSGSNCYSEGGRIALGKLRQRLTQEK